MTKKYLQQKVAQQLSSESVEPTPKSQETHAGARAAGTKVAARRSRVSVRLENGDGGDPRPPDGDFETWRSKLCAAFGTSSGDFVAMAMSHIIGLISEGGLEEHELNALLAVVDGVGPQNEAEAMLVVQLIGAHLSALKCLALMRRADRLEQFQVHCELANKFMRTYASHLETLSKLRRGGEQTVKVEHVHVYHGGQAVVGDINVSRGEGVREIDNQPHAPGSAALVSSEKVRSEDAIGRSLPRASHKRKAKVPHARRQVARRAKGK